MYTEKVRPEVTIDVQGCPTKFLCDTGACRTTIRHPPEGVRYSSHQIMVQAAQGAVKAVPTTEPIWLRDPEGRSCQLSVLVLRECPVNLLGRDGLVALGLAIIPTKDGLKIVRSGHSLYVPQGHGDPSYYYTLDIPNKPPTLTGSALLNEGKRFLKHRENMMSPDNLHVTMYFAGQINQKYQDQLDKATPVTITVTYLYSDEESRAAAAVKLPDKLGELYKSYSSPHISLCKDKHSEWKDMGRMVDQASRAQDWEPCGTNSWYSKSCGMTKRSLFWTLSVNAGVHIQAKAGP